MPNPLFELELRQLLSKLVGEGFNMLTPTPLEQLQPPEACKALGDCVNLLVQVVAPPAIAAAATGCLDLAGAPPPDVVEHCAMQCATKRLQKFCSPLSGAIAGLLTTAGATTATSRF